MSFRNGLLLALVLVTLGLPRTARAQVAAESVSSGTPNPDRFLFENGKYVDVTNSPRPQNLNPTGVNYTDCEKDLRLDVPLIVSGFAPGDAAHVEFWAGVVDCTQDANRLAAGGVAHACWQVAPSTGAQNAVSEMMLPVSIFARNILRYEPLPTGDGSQPFDDAFHDSAQGESACHVQTTDAAVPLSIYAIPVGSTGQAIGTSWQLTLDTDIVGPPPPTHVSAAGGSGSLDVTWDSPGADPDIVGYALWTAPSQNGNCGSPELQGPQFTVASGEGISLLPAQYLAGEVDDTTATNLTWTNATGGTRYAAVVTSVDGSGNYGPVSDSACAEPTASSSPTVKGGCACAAAGPRSWGWQSLLAGLALAATLARRRASRGGTMSACADRSPS